MTDNKSESNLNKNDNESVSSRNVVKINQQSLLSASNKICNDKECRYRQLGLRILIYIIASSNAEGRIAISAKRLSKDMNVHYNTVTKCLKYLRQIDVLRAR